MRSASGSGIRLGIVVRTVVHCIDTTEFGGAERAAALLLRNLDRSQWRCILLHHDARGLAPLLRDLDEHGIERVVMPTLRGVAGSSAMPSFLRILSRLEPDVFHAHLNWPLACTLPLLGAALRRIPARVATVHLFEMPRVATSLRLQQSVVTRTVHRYVAVSSDVARRVHEEMGVPRDSILVVPNGVSTSTTPAAVDIEGVRQAYGIPAGAFVVLALARLTEQKGLKYLIDAAVHVPNAVFLVAGDGPCRQNLEEQVRNSKLEGRVILTGFVEDTDSLLAACNLFVLPSLYEGMPLSILEAMSQACPVVASDIPGVRDVIVHGETGLLVPAGDAVSLAGAISELVRNPDGAVRMGVAGAARVRLNFSTTSNVSAIESLYSRLLGGDSRQQSLAHHAGNRT